MRAGASVAMVVFLVFAGGAFAGTASRTEKDTVVLAKEVEGKIIKKKDETVRVESNGCQFSFEFTNHNVTFLVPLRGSRIAESDNADGVVLINNGIMRKFRDRAAEPYERLYLRFDRRTVDQMMTRFQQVIKACET